MNNVCLFISAILNPPSPVLRLTWRYPLWVTCGCVLHTKASSNYSKTTHIASSVSCIYISGTNARKNSKIKGDWKNSDGCIKIMKTTNTRQLNWWNWIGLFSAISLFILWSVCCNSSYYLSEMRKVICFNFVLCVTAYPRMHCFFLLWSDM